MRFVFFALAQPLAVSLLAAHAAMPLLGNLAALPRPANLEKLVAVDGFLVDKVNGYLQFAAAIDYSNHDHAAEAVVRSHVLAAVAERAVSVAESLVDSSGYSLVVLHEIIDCISSLFAARGRFIRTALDVLDKLNMRRSLEFTPNGTVFHPEHISDLVQSERIRLETEDAIRQLLDAVATAAGPCDAEALAHFLGRQ